MEVLENELLVKIQKKSSERLTKGGAIRNPFVEYHKYHIKEQKR